MMVLKKIKPDRRIYISNSTLTFSSTQFILIYFFGRENTKFKNELLKSSTVQESLNEISLFQSR